MYVLVTSSSFCRISQLSGFELNKVINCALNKHICLYINLRLYCPIEKEKKKKNRGKYEQFWNYP